MNITTLDKLRAIHKLLGEVIEVETGVVDPDLSLTKEEVDYIKAGQPIYAIKEVRRRTGLTLSQAKVLVETAGDKMGLRVPDTQGWGGHRWIVPLK